MKKKLTVLSVMVMLFMATHAFADFTKCVDDSECHFRLIKYSEICEKYPNCRDKTIYEFTYADYFDYDSMMSTFYDKFPVEEHEYFPYLKKNYPGEYEARLRSDHMYIMLNYEMDLADLYDDAAQPILATLIRKRANFMHELMEKNTPFNEARDIAYKKFELNTVKSMELNK